MGIKAPGNSSRGSAPYSRAFTNFAAPIDLTEASITANPSGVAGTNGGPASGSRHGASSLLVMIPTAGGVLTLRDCAGVAFAITFPAVAAGNSPPVWLPFGVSEITSFTGGAGAQVVASWHD